MFQLFLYKETGLEYHNFLEYHKKFDLIHKTWKSTEIFIMVVTHQDLLVLKLKIKDCSLGN